MENANSSARQKKTLARHQFSRGKSVVPVASKHWTVGLGEILAVLVLCVLIWAGVSAWLAVPHHIAMLRPYSYAAVFFLSIIGSALVLVPTLPVQVAIVALGRTLDPVGFGIAAGIGSGIGELTSYGVGRGGQEMIRALPKWTHGLVELQKKMVRYHAGLAVFALALIPDPLFGLVGITAGLAGMSIWEFLFYAVCGRIIHYAVLAYLAAHLGVWTGTWF